MRDAYDVVVVGGGVAGLSAALTLGRARRSVLVIDAGTPRNAPAAHVHNVITRDGVTPADLLAAGRADVARYGGEVVDGTAAAAERTGGGFRVTLADGRATTGRRFGNVTDLTAQVVHAAAAGVNAGVAINADLIAEETGAAVARRRSADG